jgi:hypothetical protein
MGNGNGRSNFNGIPHAVASHVNTLPTSSPARAVMGSTGNGGIVEQLTRSTAEMSPHERSEQADTMRQKLVELAAAHNRLVEVVDQHSKAVDALGAAQEGLVLRHCEALDRLDSLKQQQGVTFNSLVEFCGRSFTARLRWIFLGR